MLTCEDITYQDMLIRMEDVTQFKMKILASISHELRTPLNFQMVYLDEIEH